jgi:uncharacterized protein (TIGR01244 family)
MAASAIHTISRYIELSDSLATAGQPTEAQLAALAAEGFEVVINLGQGDLTYALPDEAGCVARLGLRYVHIPVEFSSPRLDDLARFSAAMAAAQGQKVFVHCRHNKRVPVFVALDRVRRQGWDRAAAFADMHAAWSPDPGWQAFIDSALES